MNQAALLNLVIEDEVAYLVFPMQGLVRVDDTVYTEFDHQPAVDNLFAKVGDGIDLVFQVKAVRSEKKDFNLRFIKAMEAHHINPNTLVTFGISNH